MKKRLRDNNEFMSVAIIAFIIIGGLSYKYTIEPLSQITRPLDDAFFSSDMTKEVCASLMATKLDADNYTIQYDTASDLCLVFQPNATKAFIFDCNSNHHRFKVILKLQVNLSELNNDTLNKGLNLIREKNKDCEVTVI